MQKKIELAIKFLIAGSFIVPLIVIPASFIFPFIVPKILLFRSITAMMIGGYLLLLVSNWEKYKVRMTPTNIVVALFFISFSVSTFIGVDWYRSFWDNHERMLGLFTIFHYTAYYYIVTSVVREWRDWKWLLRMFLMAGAVVMFVGIWQRFVDPQAVMNRDQNRVSSTLGNAIYYSGYGMFLMFLGYLLMLKEKKNSFWWWFSIIAGFMGFVGIFLGGTRGTIVGLMAGLGMLTVCYAITLKGHDKVRRWLIYLIIAGLVSGGLLFGFRQTDFVKGIPGLGRLVNTQITGSVKTRVLAWGIAVESWKEHPVVGWGPNNYYYAFNKYYKAEFLRGGWGETWFDNAHSAVMNTLAVQGVFGIVLYVGLFGVPIYMMWGAFRRKELDPHFVSVGTAFLTAHFVHNAFVFENPTSYLYFFFFIAFLNQISSKKRKEPILKANKAISTSATVATAVVAALIIFAVNVNPARANMATLDALKLINSGGDSVKMFHNASNIPSPHIDDIRNDYARSAANLAGKYWEAGRKEEAKDMIETSYQALLDNLKLHPQDIRIHIQVAQLAQLLAQINQDMQYFYEAEKYLEEAVTFSEQRQQTLFMLALLKMQLGKSDEGIALLEKARDYDPQIRESWWRLVDGYSRLGRHEDAKKTVEEALATGMSFKSTAQKVFAPYIDAPATDNEAMVTTSSDDGSVEATIE